MPTKIPAREGKTRPSRTSEPKTPPRKRGAVRYASHEEQMGEVLEHIRKRDRKVYRALLVLLTADARFLTALGVLLEFVVQEATARGMR